MKPLFDPKVDFVFKKIFGSEKHPFLFLSQITTKFFEVML